MRQQQYRRLGNRISSHPLSVGHLPKGERAAPSLPPLLQRTRLAKAKAPANLPLRGDVRQTEGVRSSLHLLIRTLPYPTLPSQRRC